MASYNTELRRKGALLDSTFADTYYVKSTWALVDGKPSTFTPTSHLHDDRYLLIEGTAAKATILATNRTINVGTGAGGTATSFDGSANITIPINNISEAYLTWGGKNLAGQVTPIGMSLSNEHSANRLAFINGNAFTYEFSADGGSTWADYGFSALQKSQVCTTALGVLIGRTSGEYTTLSRTRIILTAQNGTTGYVYTNPKKMLINISSSGGMEVIVEYRTGSNYQSDGAWALFGTYTLSGWSGWNDIPLVLGTLGGGTTQTSNNWQLRLTFVMTSKNTTYPTTAQLNSIRIFGENAWTTPSTLATTNNLYSYDMSQNAVFPGTIQGTQLKSTIATGTAPLTVASTTLVSNLNAQYLNGQLGTYYSVAHSHPYLSDSHDASNVTPTLRTNWDAAYSATNAATNANTVSTIVKRDASGNFSAGTITAALTGTASGNEPTRTLATLAEVEAGTVETIRGFNPQRVKQATAYSQISVTATKTLALTDAYQFLVASSASAIVLTVPPVSSVAFAQNTEITIVRYGAGEVSFVAGTGVTINSENSKKKILTQYQAVTLKYIGSDVWLLIGALAA